MTTRLPRITGVIQSRPASVDDAVQVIRARIADGEWQPGSQLPTWSHMEQELGIARTTLAKVFRSLKREGFIVSDSTRGTFVAEHPPHRHRFGLVFHAHPSDPGWNRFWWTLSNLATAHWRHGPDRLVVYYGVSDHADSEGRHQLEGDLANRRLAGLIFTSDLPELNIDLSNHPEIPIVQLGDNPSGTAIPCIGHDWTAFFDRAFAYFANSGRRRVAVFHPSSQRQKRCPQSILQRHGLVSHPHWQPSIHIHNRECAWHFSRLLLDRPASDRPDALLIADDNLAASALQGVVAGGHVIGQDLDVVVHCNWPTEDEPVLPIRRLGFDNVRLLKTAVDRLRQMRLGQSQPDHQCIQPLFDDECREKIAVNTELVALTNPFMAQA